MPRIQPQQEWTPIRYAHNGDVQVAFDQLKGSEGEPLLLIMGLATARFWWPSGLCQAFADAGFAVARYDQRDAGQSTRMRSAFICSCQPFSPGSGTVATNSTSCHLGVSFTPAGLLAQKAARWPSLGGR